MERKRLQENALNIGRQLNRRLNDLARQFPHIIGCIHGKGLYQVCAQSFFIFIYYHRLWSWMKLVAFQFLRHVIEISENEKPNKNLNLNIIILCLCWSCQGIEIVQDASPARTPGTAAASAICERLLELGVIGHATGDHSNVLKVKPPLCINQSSADFFVNALELILRDHVISTLVNISSSSSLSASDGHSAANTHESDQSTSAASNRSQQITLHSRL